MCTFRSGYGDSEGIPTEQGMVLMVVGMVLMVVLISVYLVDN
jgi:hypothetical protein